MKKFNNRPNRFVTSDSDSGWISRSCVVVALIHHDNKILCVKRGDDMTQSGKWCMPCGYLDWNETIEQAVHREVYEESGIYLPDIEHELHGPVHINSHPIGKKQNITFHYHIELDSLVDFNISVVDPGEVTDIAWVEKDHITEYDFAFNHNNIINEYFKG